MLDRLGVLSPLIAPDLEPMVAMFARQPVLNRLLVQETSHIFDLSAGAMAHELPITLGNLYGFENHMPVSHGDMP